MAAATILMADEAVKSGSCYRICLCWFVWFAAKKFSVSSVNSAPLC